MQTKKEKLKTFVKANMDKIYRLAFSYAKNKQDAEDIVNESVKRALIGVKSLREDAYMGTWFYRIEINTANSYLKSKSKIIYIDDITEENLTVEDNYQDTDLYNQVMKLESKYRVIIILKYYEDMTIEQIAGVLNENISTVKTRLYRALDKLKIEYKEKEKLDERNRF